MYQVELCTLQNDWEACDEEHETYKDYSLDEWRECVSQISKFSNLKEVALKFSPHVGTGENYFDPPESVSLRTQVLNTLFKALDHKDINVVSLSIEHLQDLTVSVYNTTAFENVRNKLKSLHLKIAVEWNEYGPSQDLENPEKHGFFKQDLNTHWLEPLQSQITHLSLYAGDFFGVYPRWDPRKLHFRHLKSLSLGMWSLAHTWQVDWLLSHANSLEELNLEDCPIAQALRFDTNQHQRLSWEPNEMIEPEYEHLEYIMYSPLRWSSVLSQLSSRLHKLRRFGMAPVPWYEQWPRRRGSNDNVPAPAQLHASRYCIFNCGVLPTPWCGEHTSASATIDETQFKYLGAWDSVYDAEKGEMTKLKDIYLDYPQERESEERALKELLERCKARG